MADPKVKVVVEADGETKQGVLQPSAGTTIEVMVTDALRGTIGFDYSKPDVLALRLGGDIRLRVGGAGNVRVEGDLEKSLVEGAMAFDGAVTWEFSKDAVVQVDTSLAKDDKSVGMRVTLKFG